MSLNAKSNIVFGASSGKVAERTKPPHSYIALIATAIINSPEKKLTLTEINDYLVKNYAFFRGSYQGWKNSVRHNLSFNKCFVKILRDPARPWGKDNLWAVRDLHDYLLADGSFRRRRRRKPKKDKTLDETENENFGETAIKQQHQPFEIEEHEDLVPRFPMLQVPTHKRSSEMCRATPHTKPSPRKFSGPFSIESILAPDKPIVKKCLSQDGTGSRSYSEPALISRKGKPQYLSRDTFRVYVVMPNLPKLIFVS